MKKNEKHSVQSKPVLIVSEGRKIRGYGLKIKDYDLASQDYGRLLNAWIDVETGRPQRHFFRHRERDERIKNEANHLFGETMKAVMAASEEEIDALFETLRNAKAEPNSGKDAVEAVNMPVADASAEVPIIGPTVLISKVTSKTAKSEVIVGTKRMTFGKWGVVQIAEIKDQK